MTHNHSDSEIVELTGAIDQYVKRTDKRHAKRERRDVINELKEVLGDVPDYWLVSDVLQMLERL